MPKISPEENSIIAMIIDHFSCNPRFENQNIFYSLSYDFMNRIPMFWNEKVSKFGARKLILKHLFHFKINVSYSRPISGSNEMKQEKNDFKCQTQNKWKGEQWIQMNFTQ